MSGSDHPVEDARGLLCPLPVIRLGTRLRSIPPGGTLELWADDPAAEEDARLWAKSHGHHVLEVVRQADFIRIRVRKHVG